MTLLEGDSGSLWSTPGRVNALVSLVLDTDPMPAPKKKSATIVLKEEYERALSRGFTGRLYTLVASGYPIRDKKEFLRAFLGRYVVSGPANTGVLAGCITTDVGRLGRLVNKKLLEPSEVYPIILTCSDTKPVMEFIQRHPLAKFGREVRDFIRRRWVEFFIWGKPNPPEKGDVRHAKFLHQYLSVPEYTAMLQLGQLFDKKVDLDIPPDFDGIEAFVLIQSVLHS